jgi:hypothetical protein
MHIKNSEQATHEELWLVRDKLAEAYISSTDTDLEGYAVETNLSLKFKAALNAVDSRISSSLWRCPIWTWGFCRSFLCTTEERKVIARGELKDGCPIRLRGHL